MQSSAMRSMNTTHSIQLQAHFQSFKICGSAVKENARENFRFIFEKVLAFLSLLWYVVVLTEVQPMKSMIKELWHGNIIPQEDSRTNSKEMKELLGYMARHHEDLAKTFTDEQKEIFEKFHVAKSETIEYRFGRVKPLKARSWQSRASAGDTQRLCDGGEKLGRVRKPCRSSHLRICLPTWSKAHNGGAKGHIIGE